MARAKRNRGISEKVAISLGSLSYRELQALAKKAGVTANQNAQKLIKALS